MKIIHTSDRTFPETFSRIKGRGKIFDADLWKVVSGIVEDVAKNGDAALFRYTKKFDGIRIDKRTVEWTNSERDAACLGVSDDDFGALQLAADRIDAYHRMQKLPPLGMSEEIGIELGQRVLPMERIGIYAPGGRAVYPSTVLMAAIPARIAGVEEVILVTPSADGKLNPLIAAAAKIGKVDRIFKVGGAQAVAALAYGTDSIPAVDKIVGPGNAYVATAKKLVFGQTAIDMIAGPSEVLIIADGTVPASYAAADLLAQAEHDVMASSVLLTPSEDYARLVGAEVEEQLLHLSRRDAARQSLADYGVLIVTVGMEEAIVLANRFAPEHLELMTHDYQAIMNKIRNAGAVFLGGNTPEALGDYLAGPNHILPTGGTARFFSPLGVYDFLKRTSLIYFSEKGLNKYGPEAARLAMLEGFDAHARSVSLRTGGKKS